MIKRWARIAAVFFAGLVTVLAQTPENQITIRIHEPPQAAGVIPPTNFLNGYDSTVSGQTIEYHSSDPDADTALLVRAQSIAPSISWKTDPIPLRAGFYAQFIWLAGIESRGFKNEEETHRFDLFINNERWFSFVNRKDEGSGQWKVSGHDGAQLSFTSIMSDNVGDIFGYMILKVPTESFPAGQPLTVRVDGDNSGSADWYMTFQHRFSFVPQLRAEPALVRNGSKTSQVLRLSLDNLTDGRTIEVDAPNEKPIQRVLKVGSNILQLPIATENHETTWTVRFERNGERARTSTVRVPPVKRRTFYLLSYSHNDIGYTDLQPDVERKQWHNLDEAMRLIRETRDYPEGARYKWNLETIWALESYLKQASPAQKEEFLADVKQESIGVTALYANMLTGLANSVEMSHFFDFARNLRAEYNLPISTASTSDVPGFSWGIVSALAQSGVKYFATAPNSGDRIGYTLQAWGDKPFYWSSQSGQQKVLTWMAGASYSSFHEGSLSKMGDEKILKLARKLDENSYPYEIVQLPYTLADNGPPDPTLADFVKRWNERYVTPRLILATHHQMFEDFERRYGPRLPVIQGDFTPYWEDGAASTAFETAMNRAAVDRLIQGETLWAMLSPSSYPREDYEDAWRNVIFYDEHTWGAHNSIEEPDLPFVKQQWEFKRKFALDADRGSRELLAKALHTSAHADPTRTAVDVYNINSWPRTDLVLIPAELSSAGDHVSEIGGQPVPSQRLSTGELAVLVENVAPYSAKRLLIEKGTAYSKVGIRADGNKLKNEYIGLSVNPQTGAIDDLKWKEKGVEFVDRAKGAGLGQYLYVLGTNAEKSQSLANVRVHIKEQGDLVASLLVEADAPGAQHYSSEIRLVQGIDRVDLFTNIDKQAVRQKEGVHIAFPFAVPEGQVRYDVAAGVVRPEVDQLAGACKNFFSVQNWVDISNREYGVTLATVNAPLIEIGAITAEQAWMKSIQPSPLIYSYVMNNYWHTNYKADQAGPVTFKYSLLPHATFNASGAVKFGIERREPLIVAAADAAVSPPASLMKVTPDDIIITSLKPGADGKSWLAYLYNPTSTAQEIHFEFESGMPASVRPSDAEGREGNPVPKLTIDAHDTEYLLVSK